MLFRACYCQIASVFSKLFVFAYCAESSTIHECDADAAESLINRGIRGDIDEHNFYFFIVFIFSLWVWHWRWCRMINYIILCQLCYWRYIACLLVIVAIYGSLRKSILFRNHCWEFAVRIGGCHLRSSAPMWAIIWVCVKYVPCVSCVSGHTSNMG